LGGDIFRQIARDLTENTFPHADSVPTAGVDRTSGAGGAYRPVGFPELRVDFEHCRADARHEPTLKRIALHILFDSDARSQQVMAYLPRLRLPSRNGSGAKVTMRPKKGRGRNV